MKPRLLSHPLIVLQPTPLCNIDCSYCYLPHRQDRRRMPLALVARMADEVFAAPWWEGPCTFLWHLGEPLTLPIAYYEEAFALIEQAARQHGRQYSQTMQTNAILLDEDWVAFLKRHQVRLGVSVDGPAFIHDRHRQTRRGTGTHEQVMRGIRLLQDGGLAFGAIAVVTKDTLDHADAMFQFFLDSGIDELAFNVDELEGVHQESSFAEPEALARYRRFMQRMVDLIDASQGRIRLRELWKYLPALLRAQPVHNMSSEALRIVSFDCEGRFSTFCPELRVARDPCYEDFVMGDIKTQPLTAILDSPVFKQVSEEIAQGLQACEAQCAYWQFCGGGDPSSKYFEHGRFDVSETLTCRVHKQATIDAIVSHLEAVPAGRPRHWMKNYGQSRP